MTIDEYILSQPENLQETLWAVRNTIATTLPNAQERISYGMPTFCSDNRHCRQSYQISSCHLPAFMVK